MEHHSTASGAPPERPHFNGSNGEPMSQPLHRPTSLMSTSATVPASSTLTTPTSPTPSLGADKVKATQLTLTINKDGNGYGMKVSGDNPVFVESVKSGGAAQKAGLYAGDMILKVNGSHVRYSTHTDVVQLIKASPNVELTVQRSHRALSRPSVSILQPSSPATNHRNSITAPLPVDLAKRREMEFSKMQTLTLMLEQERKNRDNLKSLSHEQQKHNEILKAETTIRALQDQLSQMSGEGTPFQLYLSEHSGLKVAPPTASVSTSSAPAFLSRFPRSLSQLNLGTKKKAPPVATPHTNPANNGDQHNHSDQNNVNTIKVASGHPASVLAGLRGDIPPPLPQRNAPRKSLPSTPLEADPKSVQVSDLDSSMLFELIQQQQKQQVAINQHLSCLSPSPSQKSKKKTKTKIKALSDPKMSSQVVQQMDLSYPPPLPPRQLLATGNPIQTNSHSQEKESDSCLRPQPNSVNTLMSYPLITTCTAVRDNIQPPRSPQANRILLEQLQHQHLKDLQRNSSQNQAVSSAFAQASKSKHSRTRSSPKNEVDGKKWDKKDKSEVTPPGTPPPPYLSNLPINRPQSQISAAQSNVAQKPIISMEDDEPSDQEPFIEENSAFRSLKSLLEAEHISYLTVFLNFVLSNSNPAPLLFYLITDLYKEGSGKDMRKWAYEIHSTFLVPTAPMLLTNVGEQVARDIDDILQREYEKAEILRKVFFKSRSKAREIIMSQLEEFQVKRTAGLGTMYGPSDQLLADGKGDRNKETKIVDEHLIPKLQQYLTELDSDSSECPKKLALCSALSTVLHRIFVTRSQPSTIIDKVHHFVSREKSFKHRIMSKHRKAQVRGHHLALRQYYEVTHCNHCQNLIWGVGPQGYQCSDCELNIHRTCSKVLEENCPGPVTPKRKDHQNDNKISKLMDKIRPNAHSQSERAKKNEEDSFNEDFFPTDRIANSFGAGRVGTSMHQPEGAGAMSSDGHGSAAGSPSGTQLGHMGDAASALEYQQQQEQHKDGNKSKSAPVSVNRSESYKERSQKRQRTNRRKTSDPSLSKNDDEHLDLGFIKSKFSGSSNSSLSSNSPSTSADIVEPVPASNAGNAAFIHQAAQHQQTLNTSLQKALFDSEDEEAGEDADWSSNIAPHILARLTDPEKKRQEIINEIYRTERNHVRTLKLLEHLFMQPLGVLNMELMQLLFPPSLLILRDLHSSFETSLKQRRVEHNALVGDLGDLLLNTFEGKSGDELNDHAALFCSRQQIALEALKEKRKKDEKLQRILNNAESHKACRRLQLKDLLPTVLQRLTKYPLLFESLLKITKQVDPENLAEAEAIKKALDSSKKILDHVNQAVREAEDSHKLQTIQKKLIFEKDLPLETKNLDLTSLRLIHDGHLVLKKNSGIHLQGLLFENMIVLLQKQEDKYILKYYTNPGMSGESKNRSEERFNPVTKINLILVRQSAVDKTTFFLINTNLSQMLELTAPSSSECKTWFKHITETTDAYKQRIKSQNYTSTSGDTAPAIPAIMVKEVFEQLQPEVPDPKEDVPRAVTPPITPSTPSGSNKLIINVENEDDASGGTGAVQEEEDTSPTATTQPECQLVPPTEIHVRINSVLQADRVQAPGEKLRRLDAAIRKQLRDKQQIICDMFRVPLEHFQAIADIAAQPEAPQEPADLVLAAFAQTQQLTDQLNESMKATAYQEVAAVSRSLCDDCYAQQQENVRVIGHSLVSVLPPVGSAFKEDKETAKDDETDNLYCEIDIVKLRHDLLSDTQAPDVTVTHMEVNDNYNSDIKQFSTESNAEDTPKAKPVKEPSINRLIHVTSMAPNISCNLIQGNVTKLNTLISQLAIKISERDIERDQLRKENQRLRELLNGYHDCQIVTAAVNEEDPNMSGI